MTEDSEPLFLGELQLAVVACFASMGQAPLDAATILEWLRRKLRMDVPVTSVHRVLDGLQKERIIRRYHLLPSKAKRAGQVLPARKSFELGETGHKALAELARFASNSARKYAAIAKELSAQADATVSTHDEATGKTLPAPRRKNDTPSSIDRPPSPVDDEERKSERTAMRAGRAVEGQDDLPKRVREVLQLLLEGHGEKQVAARLGISVHTVHVYVKMAYKAFDVNSRAELLGRFVAAGQSAVAVNVLPVEKPTDFEAAERIRQHHRLLNR